MATSQKKKEIQNMVYGLGGAVVILGALFKILHWELGPLNGSVLLAAGLITEAGIFVFSAFEAPEEDLDWSLAYPELKGGSSSTKSSKGGDVQAVLTESTESYANELNSAADQMKALNAMFKEQLNSSKNQSAVQEGIAQNGEALKARMEEFNKNLEALNQVYGGMLTAMNRK